MGLIHEASVGKIKETLRLPTNTPSFHEQYILRGALGAGAFAQVFVATKVQQYPERQEKPVAVKIMDMLGKSTMEIDSRVEKIARNEASALRKVGYHPNVVNLLEEFVEDNIAYMVLERCEKTLLQALETCPEFTERSLRDITSDMLKALTAIHKIGVVHRDVKPDNFLCSEELTVKLCDFGLSQVLPGSGGSGGLTGVYGTAPFMSPEMLSSAEYGAGTDVWSVGVIVYSLLFGRWPYQPVKPSAKSMKAAIVQGYPAPSYRPRDAAEANVTDAAVQSLRRLLDRDPAQRPSAAKAKSLPWFSRNANAEAMSVHSLRHMLYAAKCQGVFTICEPRHSRERSALEIVLDKKQALYRGTSIHVDSHLATPNSLPNTPTSPSSRCTGLSQRRGCLDPTKPSELVGDQGGSTISTCTRSSGPASPASSKGMPSLPSTDGRSNSQSNHGQRAAAARFLPVVGLGSARPRMHPGLTLGIGTALGCGRTRIQGCRSRLPAGEPPAAAADPRA